MGRRKIELRESNDGYFLDYHCIDGIRHQERKISKQKKIAEDYRNMRLAEYTNGICKICEDRKRNRESITYRFKEIADQYLNEQALGKKKSLRVEESIVKKLTEYFGKKSIYEISVKDIKKYKTERMEKVANDTINHELSIFRQIINFAINELEVKGLTNPVSKIKFETPNERDSFLIKSEAMKLEEVAYAKDKVKGLAVIMAIRTGLRRANLLNLRWNQIDFTFDPLLIKIPAKEVKTGKDLTVHIFDKEVVNKILDLPSRLLKHDYLFTDKNGRPYQNLLDFLRTCLVEAGLLSNNIPRLKDFNWHSLRRTFASILAMEGVDLNTIREAGGWKDLSMVLRYARLSPVHIKKAFKTMDFSEPEMSSIGKETESQPEQYLH